MGFIWVYVSLYDVFTSLHISFISFCTQLVLMSCPVRGEELEKLSPRVVRANSRCGGLGVPLNAPKQMQPQEAMRGNRDEAMTPTNINPHKS